MPLRFLIINSISLGILVLYALSACVDASTPRSEKEGPNGSIEPDVTDSSMDNDERLSRLSALADVGDARDEFVYFEFVLREFPNSEELRSLAFDRLESAATKGYAEAQLQLGFFLNSGIHVPENRDAGLYWLLLAGQQENVDAQKLLGAEFVLRMSESLNDRDTLRRNAVYWLRKAMMAGDLESKSLLGKLLVQTDESREEGLQLLVEAAKHGSESAQEAIDLIEREVEYDPNAD